MIEVTNLSKRYGSHLAVDDVSFQVNDGEILGFLGPNGAGKSTTMNILTGYISATSGSVKIDGYDILEDANEAKRRIGYLPEHPPLYPDMTVKEYLHFIFDLKKVKLPRDPHIKEVCRLVRIEDVYERLIRNLSKGFQQRVGIAQALIGNPDVLVLDEPTVGLDPKQIIEIRNLIHHLGRNHTVILSSHILPEVQAICERIVIINRGVMIADDTPDNLSKLLSDNIVLTVRVQGPRADVQRLLTGIPGVKSVTFMGPRENTAFEFAVEPKGKADVRRDIFERLADRHWPLLMLTANQLSLEQVFLRLTDASVDSKALREQMRGKKEEPEDAASEDGAEEPATSQDDPAASQEESARAEEPQAPDNQENISADDKSAEEGED